jgi:hypothetical protein
MLAQYMIFGVEVDVVDGKKEGAALACKEEGGNQQVCMYKLVTGLCCKVVDVSEVFR